MGIRVDHLIICDTLYAEYSHLIPEGVGCEVLPFALHSTPSKLNDLLKEAVDRVEGQGRRIAIGFGLCSHAVTGLSSDRHTLVLPRVHDCIAMFYGSQQRLEEDKAEELGTLYLTKRFIESEQGTYHLLEYDTYCERYGPRKAVQFISMVLEGYRRAVLIDTGAYDLTRYRHLVQTFCRQHSLDMDTVQGTSILFEALLGENDGEDLIIKGPGEEVSLEDYL